MFLQFRLFFNDRVLLESLWRAFRNPLELSGDPFGEPWALQSGSWATLGCSWPRLGAQRGSLGAPKRSREPHLEVPSLQDAILAVQSRSKSTTWKSKRLPRALQGSSESSQTLKNLDFSQVKSIIVQFRLIQ